MCTKMNIAIAKGQFRMFKGLLLVGNKALALEFCPYCGKPMYQELLTMHGGKLKHSIRKHDLTYVWSAHTKSFILRLSN